ncbi:MAG TPA: xylulokinase [Candidatus Limnocylindrales bacterium]|nr:xylulokinase [Candidatus Limnocylindrales bacterium]
MSAGRGSGPAGRHVLALDVSTTATKALLVDDAGGIAGVAASEYPFAAPRPGWSEQDPALWWTASLQAIREVLATSAVDPASVAAVGLSGQMHGLVLLDAAGDVIRPAILWNDQRTQRQCDAMRAAVGRERLIALTGNDALTGFTAPKILWLRDEEPEALRRTRRILLPKDYVRFRLTGEAATDCADGSGTILFDLAARAWSDEVLAALGIDPAWLPRVAEGPQVSAVIGRAAADDTGLPAGTPVVAGGGDQAANAVGLGVVEAGQVALSVGTSGVVFVATDRPVVEPDGRLHAFCHAVPGRWHLMGVMLSAAGSLRWFRDAFAPGVTFERLVEAAAGVPAGSEGLLFLPYLVGERTPHPDPDARGAFVGLTVRHGLAHLTRAVLEGVAFGLRDSLELVRAVMREPIPSVRASGGGTRSLLWRQILADVLEVPLETTVTSEGAAYGAALLAAVGAGWYTSVAEAAAACVRPASRVEPGSDRAAYGPTYAAYRDLYPALRPTFAAAALRG